ncbi:RusA family crossover junction endodeoxyribonuclease [Lysobacter sp. CA199]|uniref:RusA family crossover junction endodeoxyribonuclease n=1 Tax=Lysobacter sp. CA199 TaxID=3455608 RepID=UPI003F8CFA91
MKPITLVLPYPVSANRYWATRVVKSKVPPHKPMAITYVTPEAQEYRKEVAKLATMAGIGKLQGRVRVSIRLYPSRPQDWARRARKDPDFWGDTVQCMDLGNCEKVLDDALNGIAWTDDKQLHEIHKYRRDPDELGARVEITIEPIVRALIAPTLFGEERAA